MDTAAPKGVVLAVEGEKVLGEERFLSHEGVFPPLERLWAKTKVTLKEVEFIAIGRGPGSFTGIRVAYMAGYSMAYAKNVPLKGLSSLSLYQGDDPVVLDARSGGVWIQVPGEEPKRILPEEAESFFKTHPFLASPDPDPLRRRFKGVEFREVDFDAQKIARLLTQKAENPDTLYL